LALTEHVINDRLNSPQSDEHQIEPEEETRLAVEEMACDITEHLTTPVLRHLIAVLPPSSADIAVRCNYNYASSTARPRGS
jgi:hypothetical protein